MSARGANQDVFRKVARSLQTGDVSGHGGLTVEEVQAFITVFQEQGPLAGLVGWKKVGAKSGTLPRLSYGSELLRAKAEGVGPTHTNKPTASHVSYSLEAVRIAWEITQEFLEYNIEGEDFAMEELEAYLKTFGTDLINLCINGDQSIAPTHAKYAFRKTLDGWLTKAVAGGCVQVDASALPAGAAIGKHIFMACKKAIIDPWKTNRLAYKFLMHPDLFDAYVEVLSDSPSTAGDKALIEGTTDKIFGVGTVLEASFPTDQIMLVDPRQLAIVYNRNMKLRTTEEGVECAATDSSFSALHGDYDTVIYWPESVVLGTNITGA